MSALAALLLDPPALDDGGPLDFERRTVDPAAIERQIAEQNQVLAREPEIPESVRLFVEGLAVDVANSPLDAAFRTDPYLLVALQKSVIAALLAIENPDPAAARRDLRVRLEQLRHVYRDLADNRPIFEDRPAADLARWLTEVVDVPQARIAAVVGVSPRTFQRWISTSSETAPAEDDARRLRMIASVVVHLRHALTGQGVIGWFETPHPLADSKAPMQLVEQQDGLPQLMRLAASTRSALAA